MTHHTISYLNQNHSFGKNSVTYCDLFHVEQQAEYRFQCDPFLVFTTLLNSYYLSPLKTRKERKKGEKVGILSGI